MEKSTPKGFEQFKSCINAETDKFSEAGLIALFKFFNESPNDLKLYLDPGLDEYNATGICEGFDEYLDLEEFQFFNGNRYATMEDIENAAIVIRINDEAFIVSGLD